MKVNELEGLKPVYETPKLFTKLKTPALKSACQVLIMQLAPLILGCVCWSSEFETTLKRSSYLL